MPADFREDRRGRPTYGAMIAVLDHGPLPMLLENNYGRRWNRLYRMAFQTPVLRDRGEERDLVAERARANDRPGFEKAQVVRGITGVDIAGSVTFDGDKVRHGRHPAWLKEWAKENPRYEREDEEPFRSNGNSFDAAVGDIDNDGDFDFFVSTIKHAWAGDLSDVSRFFVNLLMETGGFMLENRTELSVDRWPPPPAEGEEETEIHKRQNQGDIFCELADLDHDGRLDLILCSSDYPNPPSYEERLRVFLQRADGTFADRTAERGLDHPVAGQPALLDLNGDTALDLAIDQTFNMIDVARRGATGIANSTIAPGATFDSGVEPRLQVDPQQGVATDAFVAIVRVWAELDGDPSIPPVRQLRQLLGPGGHAGKRHDAIVHFGLASARYGDRVEIVWPNRARTVTVLMGLHAGSHLVAMSSDSPSRFPSSNL